MSQPSLLSFIKQLYKEKRELTILEITYLIIAGISFLVSAVIALLNQALGVGLLIIPFIAFLAFSANLIVWALVKIEPQGVKKDAIISSSKSEKAGCQVKTSQKVLIDEPNSR